MEKQKLQIKYQKDSSIHSLAGAAHQKKIQNNGISLDLQNAHLAKRNKFQNKTKDLSRMIFRHKVNKLTSSFAKKIRLNSKFRQPIQFNESNNEKQIINNGYFQKIYKCFQNFTKRNGINIGNVGLIIWSLINIIQITFMVFIFSIIMTFSQTKDYSLFLYCRTFSIFLYIIDMVLNFIVKRYEGGKDLQKISQISWYYLKNGFVIDLISILIFPIDVFLNTQSNATIFISFVAIIKLVNNIKKFQKFQYLLINNSEKQRYYGLVKVFLTNFAIGHFLSIFLNLMACINSNSSNIPHMNDNINWRIKFGIQQADWHIKYIWGYYWGTNIMLTVGFGDLTATNYIEAIILVFIQTVSCITLAYNINYVGAIISSMKEDGELKKKRLKTFHRMCQQNFVPNQMESKISNYIQQSFRIKQSFEYDAHDEVLKSLPKILERQYRKQANKTLFINLGFFSNLSKKTLLRLAQQIDRKICHPEQIILRKGNVYDFMILQKGCLSLTCRVNSILDGKQIETLQIKQKQKPKILSLDFIKNKVLNYNVKSNNYSVLYYLARQDFMNVLRTSQMDYQFFCVLKDIDNKQIDQNNLYLCSVCKNQYHNKFECSRLHYIPLKRMIAHKFIHQTNKRKQHRQQNFKRKKVLLRSIFCIQQLKQNQKRFIEDNFDNQHCLQIQQLRQFYNKYMENKNLHQNTNTQTTFFKSCKTNGNQILRSTKTNFKGFLDDKVILKLQQMFQNKVSKTNKFWQLEIDQAHNFKYYFKQGNPQSLKKTKKSKRAKSFLTCYI